MAGFFKKLFNKVTNKAEIDWDDLEAELIAGDLGVRLSVEIVEELRNLGRKISADDVIETTRKNVSDLFQPTPTPLRPAPMASPPSFSLSASMAPEKPLLPPSSDTS